ncbi:hypothetical protein ACIBG7_43200 [Nonomuraea sp. NPDC050328]|uniref:hypothetical protein n=1 Tax=Nonomuraea sp. NPDC050328 TaxID=3364361 RepID=UPI0037BDBC31
MARSDVRAMAAELAGTVLRAAWLALPGLAGVGLTAYGAWLAWPPAGYITAGVLVLADRVLAYARTDRREPS